LIEANDNNFEKEKFIVQYLFIQQNRIQTIKKTLVGEEDGCK